MHAINTQQTKILISFYCYLRIILAIILISIAIIGRNLDYTEEHGSLPFFILASTYLTATLLQFAQFYRHQYRYSTSRLLIAILIDEFFILGMMFLSGGVSTGIAILLVTPISIAAIFFTGNRATLFAATAAIGLLANHVYLIITEASKVRDEIQVGTLGITFFITSLGIQYLSRYIRQTEKKVIESQDLTDKIVELNKHIVQRIRTGVIIFDEKQEIILNNKAALRALSDINGKMIADDKIKKLLQIWLENGSNNHILHQGGELSDLQINFSALDDKGHIITFIDDISEMAQQALQMKLAALGRLSASIAHEIRNPLNAISHSVQLLEESTDIQTDLDIKLLSIAKNHIHRIDEIIHNILSMSHKREYFPERINLTEFANSIKKEYQDNPSYPDIDFQIVCKNADIQVPFDRSQLHQILSNIIDNGLRYSHRVTGNYWIKIYINNKDDKAFINIYDQGGGIPSASADKLFEPFFTSESTGTGLGLYLSREFCTLNQSQLNYIHNNGVDHHFQIRFAHADRDILLKTNNNAPE